MRRFKRGEQEPPPPRPVTDGVVTRMDGILEVDPELMGTYFHQQPMPVWDSERLVSSRTDHLDWMHRHFADETLLYGSASEATDEPPE
jgi:hypothetical protein